MSSMTPMTLKRRTVGRIAASNPRLKAMEQRAHNNSVLTYSSDIYEHLSILEETTKMSPNLIQQQPQINIEMRPILFDFLMDVYNRLKLSPSTFFLTINIIDRYCSLRVVRKDHFQLLGLTAFWLASKFSDAKQKIPSVDFLRATCCNCYSKNLFVEMETHILKSLNWEIGSSTHDSFIDLVLRERAVINNQKLDSINSMKYGATFICQLVQFHHRITFNYPCSQIAVASVVLVSSALQFDDERNFIHYTALTKNNFRLNSLIEAMLNVLRYEDIPMSLKTRYFNKTDDVRINPSLSPIYRYSNELVRLNPIHYPQTPSSSPYFSSTPSRTSSYSSSGDSYASLITPPSSCSSSPIDGENTTPQVKQHRAFAVNPYVKPPSRELKVHSPDQERKRSLEM